MTGATCFGDLLMIVPPLVKEPCRALISGRFRPRCDHRAHHFIPRPVFSKGGLEKAIPPTVPAALFAAACVASHEQCIPDLAKGARIFLTREQLIDQRGALVGSSIEKKRVCLAAGGQPSGEIKINPTHKGSVVATLGRDDPARAPAKRQEVIDRRGWLRRHSSDDGRFFFGLRIPERDDPRADGGDLVGSQLLFRRHVRVGAGLERSEQGALLRLARQNHRTCFIALEHCREMIELQTRLLLQRAVALYTVLIEQGLHATFPKRPSTGAVSGRGAGKGDQEKKRRETKHAKQWCKPATVRDLKPDEQTRDS